MSRTIATDTVELASVGIRVLRAANTVSGVAGRPSGESIGRLRFDRRHPSAADHDFERQPRGDGGREHLLARLDQHSHGRGRAITLLLVGMAVCLSLSGSTLLTRGLLIETVYSELKIVMEAEGQRHEIINYGRCLLYDKGYQPWEGSRIKSVSDGSLPALRLPSGSAVLFRKEMLNPCARIVLLNLVLAHMTQPFRGVERLALDAYGVLKPGQELPIDLSRSFDGLDLNNFVAWLDNAADPTSVIGYVGNLLSPHPDAKVQIVSANLRILSASEWAGHKPTRVEEIVPWEAKFCPYREKAYLRQFDLSWGWIAPVAVVVSLSELPEGDWKRKYLKRSGNGLQPVSYELAKAIPQLEDRIVNRQNPLLSFLAQDDRNLALDLDHPPQADALLFHRTPELPLRGIVSFNLRIDEALLQKKDPYMYHPFFYAPARKVFINVGESASLTPSPCSFIP